MLSTLAFVTLASAALATNGISPGDSAAEALLIASVRQMPARQVDPTQGPEPLEAWLTELVGREAEANWSVGSCDLKPDYSQPEESWPLCVEFRARREDSLGVRLHIDLGTFGKPDLAKASVHPQSFAWWWCRACDRETASTECTMLSISSLKALIAARDALRSNPKCHERRPN
jgi:hypothetical protein